MVQRTDELRFKDSSTVKRPECILATVKSLLASLAVLLGSSTLSLPSTGEQNQS